MHVIEFVMACNEDESTWERLRYHLRASGVRDLSANPYRSGIHSRGYLPHVKREGAEYFVTFRLADSLPKQLLLRLQSQKAERLRALERARRPERSKVATRQAIERAFVQQVERLLDTGLGACHLRRPEVAQLVVEALKYFDGQRYLLREWVVMPNHVHVLFWPQPGFLVGDIVKSWKQFTSMRAKRLLGLSPGRFWQPEAFDRWVRDAEHRSRIARYIWTNPVKAGLCERPEDWPWSSAHLKPGR